MGSKNLRGSKIMGELGLDDDSKRSIPKMPEFSQKSLSNTDEHHTSEKKKTSKFD